MADYVSFNSVGDFEAKVREAVSRKEDIRIKTSRNTSEALAVIKRILEENGLRFRVYTSMRSGAATAATAGGVALLSEAIPIATAVAPTPVMVVLGTVGVGAAVGIAAHRIATRNPDYEVVKYPLKKELWLRYKTRIDVSEA